jgi:YidC/Oxa1 family membrane protein insertase
VTQDKRSLFAIVLCVLFYLAYDRYLKTKYPEYGKKPDATSTELPATPDAAPPTGSAVPPTAGDTAIAAPATPRLTADQLTIDNDVATYRFSQEMGAIDNLTLKDFKASRDADSGPVALFDHPLVLQGVTDPKQTTGVRGVFSAERTDLRTLKLERLAGAVKITQVFQFPETGYGGTLTLTFTNTGATPIDLTAGLLMQETAKSKKGNPVLGLIPGAVTEQVQLIRRADGSTDWTNLEKFCDGDPISGSRTSVSYLGIDKHYFLGVVEPKAKTGSFTASHGAAGDAGCPVSIVSYDSQGTVAPGASATMEYALYFGPKALDTMRAHSVELESAMHLGTFDFIARPLLQVIEGFTTKTGNYGVSIILLTFLLKVLFYPLVRASSVSAFKMRKLNPEIQSLREKYKDDKVRQQQEMMQLWSKHKINPMKGCLPILPQIPVFFAFYQVLQNSIHLRHAPFYGWIHDLSAMDPYLVTPLLMGVAMFVQQRLTPTTGMDKTQEKIMMFMPVMFTAMMLSLPAGLTLYMLTNTVTGIAQQRWLYYKLEKAGA